MTSVGQLMRDLASLKIKIWQNMGLKSSYMHDNSLIMKVQSFLKMLKRQTRNDMVSMFPQFCILHYIFQLFYNCYTRVKYSFLNEIKFHEFHEWNKVFLIETPPLIYFKPAPGWIHLSFMTLYFYSTKQSYGHSLSSKWVLKCYKSHRT